MANLSETSIYLYWHVGNQAWTTKGSFQVNSRQTYGGYWFNLPPFVRFKAEDTFTLKITMPHVSLTASKGQVSGTYSGNLKAGGDSVYGSNLAINSATIKIDDTESNTIQAYSDDLPLLTDPITHQPYIKAGEMVIPFVQFNYLSLPR